VLSATRAFAAVGSLSPEVPPSAADAVRVEIDALLVDVALTAGHDAGEVLDLANAALAVDHLGTVASVALFTGTAMVVADAASDCPIVSGAGLSPPLVITGGDLALATDHACRLAPGWSVVLADAGPLLTPAEVRAALAMLSAGATGKVARTTLVVRIT
jgi:hypothetical protein